jgi:nitroimidazol reductase NimA-like FMN-containing flavoprotein (pyridoxamine 5'-phosphate oxidase superfamily)
MTELSTEDRTMSDDPVRTLDGGAPATAQANLSGGMALLDDAECRAVLLAHRLGILAAVDGDEPYAIPMFYGWDGESLWLGISEGRKTRILDRNPRASITVTEVLEDESWRSVIVTGRVEWVTEAEDRKRGVQALMEHNRRFARQAPPAQPAAAGGATAPRRHSGGRIMRLADASIAGRAKR